MKNIPDNILNAITTSVIVSDDKGVITWVNDYITTITGYSKNELIGQPIETLVPIKSRTKHVPLRNNYVKHSNKRKMSDSLALTLLDKENREIPVDIDLSYFYENDKKYVTCTIHTSSYNNLINKTVNIIQERLEYSQSLAHVGTWDWNIINNSLVWTDEIYKIFDVKPQEFDATYDAFTSFIYSGDRPAVMDAVNKALTENKVYSIQHRIIRPTGEIRSVLERGHVIRDDEGTPIRMIGAVLDITELVKTENKLKVIAHYDELTHIPNRAYYREKLIEIIAKAKKDKKTFSISYIDLDNFKLINDSQGHMTGDLFLKEITDKLLNSLPPGTFLSRIGGDEFVIVSELFEDVNEAKDTSKKMAQQINSLLKITKVYINCTIDISASIGIAIFPEHGNDYTEIMSSADKAMYQVKNEHKDSHSIYNPLIEEDKIKDLQLITDMKESLKKGHFHVCYQAKQCLQSGELVGCEALIRWVHPILGNIPPIKFIPLAEHSGLIHELGRFVLSQTCLLIKEWQALSDKVMTVSINASSLELKSPLFVKHLKEVLVDNEIKGEYVELEVTESLLMENVATISSRLKEIKSYGIKVSIDDFGTGYSSLSYLKNLPVDVLKIDKSFIDELSTSNKDFSIVASIISLAKNLQLKTVAEGVETEEQKLLLKSLQCDLLQGYLYCKPIQQSEFFKKFLST